MNRIGNVFIKEFRGYFVSPIAYIVISIFLIITGWFFFSTFFLYNQAELRNFFNMLPLVLSFIIPAISMRQFSEEFGSGSWELLKTLPVSTADIIAGKFLASVAFSALALVPTISYAVCISFVGDLDPGPVAGGYMGALGLIAVFSAIGLLASSLTRNQIIAFILGMAICFTVTIIDKMLFFVPGFAVSTVQYLAVGTHFQNIAKGIVDSRDIIYFLSLGFLALYMTWYNVRSRG